VVAGGGTRLAVLEDMRHPVDVVVNSPPRFDRIQLAVRLAIAIALGFIGFSAGLFAMLLFFVLPVIAAVSISSTGPTDYLARPGPRLWRMLTWVLQLSAYMLLLIDRFPVEPDQGCQITLQPAGTPSAGSAVFRLVTSIPSALVLGLLWCIAGVLGVIGWVTILVAEMVPQPILSYQRGVLRWQARLLAYHASLVAAYPPFDLDTHDDLPRATTRLHGAPG
jgi:hypothetical protein